MNPTYDADRFVGAFLRLRGTLALAIGAAMSVLFLASFWTDLEWVYRLLGADVAIGNNGASPRLGPINTTRGILGISAPLVLCLGGISCNVGGFVRNGHEPGFAFGVYLEGTLLVLSAWMALSAPVALVFWIWSLPLFAYLRARRRGMGPVPQDPYEDLDGDRIEVRSRAGRAGGKRTVR